jgi:hypothetical protein
MRLLTFAGSVALYLNHNVNTIAVMGANSTFVHSLWTDSPITLAEKLGPDAYPVTISISDVPDLEFG